MPLWLCFLVIVLLFTCVFSDDNGLNPVWNEQCEFDIMNPDVALIRFLVQDEDMFGDPNFLGQATYPVKCLRTGTGAVECNI